MTVEKLLAALEGDDAERLLQALRDSTASARSAAWEVALPHFDRRRWHAEQEALDAESWRRRVRSQALFCLAAGPPDVVHRVGGFVFGVPSEDEFVEVVALRTQPWRADFAADSLRSWASDKEVGLSGPWWWENWQRVRRYERSGVVPFDSHSADYLVVLVSRV